MILLVVSAAAVWVLVVVGLPQNTLAFFALDVGQGDSLYIETPSRHQVLIDGGPGTGVLSELSGVMPLFDKSIDVVVLTHPQEDHLFGLVEVLKRYRVGVVIMTGVNYSTRSYEEFKRVVAEKRIPVVYARVGQKVQFGDGAVMEILYPFDDWAGKDFPGDVNDTSVAVVVSFAGKKILSMGDAEMEEEVALINAEENIDADVLKVNHHGSRFSTSALFLEHVTPGIAIISAGKENRYGHPHKELLERLKDVSVYRTDTNGRIKVIIKKSGEIGVQTLR